MKKAKLAASLIAVSMAATTLLTGCNGSSNSNSGSGSGSGSSGDSSSNSGSSGDSSSNSGDVSIPDIEIPTPAQAENLPFNLKYADDTKIRIAAGYSGTNTGITFDAKTVGEGIDLSDGVHYTAGMLKPTWQALSDTLKVTFENKYGGNSASDEFKNWQAQLDQIDIVAGTATQLNETGVQGSLVDLSKYLNDMPNFKKYLEDNPIVRMSITGYNAEGKLGAIYFAPYFDGVNDIERMPLMRTDWVRTLLNGSGKFTAESSGKTSETVAYQPYMPTDGTVTVDVAKDANTKETVTKDYSKYGNIVAKMNEVGQMTGVDAVNMLRDYIDKTYDGYYGENRADLFIGQNAAWDADELVALLRCVVSNAPTLNGTDKVEGLFSREDNNNQRRVDTYKLAGILFGARGMESRQEWLYIGNDNKMHDARQEAATYVALEKMNQMAKEGLIAESYLKIQEVKSQNMLENDLGFMSYDYNQTQTLYNEQEGIMDEGEEYRAVLVPVAKWCDDGTDKVKYMRFTESWRSVKDSGWAIPKATEANTDVLNACLHLFDYAFSADGQILMSYGPDTFIDVKNKDGKTIEEKYNTFNFNGVPMPKISEGCREDLWNYGKGNYTNFARRYLGSTLHFVKSQAFEVQCTTEVGREGAQLISNAIGLGVIKHPVLSTTISNPWYISVPTILPVTKEETAQLSSLIELASAGNFNTSKNGTSMLVGMIVNGYDAEKCPGKTAEEVANAVKTTWKGETYLKIKQDGWTDILKG